MEIYKFQTISDLVKRQKAILSPKVKMKVNKDDMTSEQKERAKESGFDYVKKDVLTTAGRKHIKEENFAIPEKRAYPINDEIHARNALARVSQHGTPEEKKRVRAAVARKYPSIEQATDKK